MSRCYIYISTFNPVDLNTWSISHPSAHQPHRLTQNTGCANARTPSRARPISGSWRTPSSASQSDSQPTCQPIHQPTSQPAGRKAARRPQREVGARALSTHPPPDCCRSILHHIPSHLACLFSLLQTFKHSSYLSPLYITSLYSLYTYTQIRVAYTYIGYIYTNHDNLCMVQDLHIDWTTLQVPGCVAAKLQRI